MRFHKLYLILCSLGSVVMLAFAGSAEAQQTAISPREFAAAFTQVVHHRDPTTTAAETSDPSKAILQSRFRRFTITRDDVHVRIDIEAARIRPR